MSRHVVVWVRVLVVGFVVLTSLGALALPAAAQGGTGPGDDFDGDGISNRVDPDDDNDGVTDDQDCAPFDASVTTCGEPEPPSLIDPELDSDGDGIANRVDPDDDNDGVTDENDCAPLDPAVTSCQAPAPAPAAPARPAAPSGGSSGGSSGAAPVQSVAAPAASDRVDQVLALPVTGDGSAIDGTEAVRLTGAIAAVLALAGLVMRAIARRPRLEPVCAERGGRTP